MLPFVKYCLKTRVAQRNSFQPQNSRGANTRQFEGGVDSGRDIGEGGAFNPRQAGGPKDVRTGAARRRRTAAESAALPSAPCCRRRSRATPWRAPIESSRHAIFVLICKSLLVKELHCSAADVLADSVAD